MQPVNVPKPLHVHRVLLAIAIAFVFSLTWLFRFNDPNGSFAGLTDDHFFYLVRGWQILYGDLPVRDFVDHGAPLYYYVAAAVQVVFGRGTLSELTFTVTMIAAGAAATFWLASRASGSIALGLIGAAVHIWLMPRFYNYPKILVYAVAIPVLWWFADRRGGPPRIWLAAITVVAFLFRHDHGAFVAAAVVALLAVSDRMPWRERVRHAVVYAVLTLVLLSPYLLFVHYHGGVESYFQQALGWTARERERTEIVWPGLFDNPDGASPEARSAPAPLRPFWVVRDNATAWVYYVELTLPLLALAVLAMSRDAFRPAWTDARTKLAVVALLAVVLNAGFLRSPLNARLADPSVPHAILIAWLAAALPAMFRLPESWRPRLVRQQVLLASLVAVAAAPLAFTLAVLVPAGLAERLAAAGLADGPDRAFQGAALTVDRVRSEWELANWEHRENRPDLVTLAMYVNACTPPGARIFVEPYIPQVLPLARRAFAGGHAELRSGFFADDGAQALTLARLQRQNVPMVLLAAPAETFQQWFPPIGRYLRERYEEVGTHEFDGRFMIHLLLRKDLRSRRQFAELDWPCPHDAT